jgi:hypothetical protein
LNLHAVSAAASEAAASTVSPRVHCPAFGDGAATADRTPVPPYQSGALPLDDCGPAAAWCWLEDSNLPPLAYKASALPDELSQICNLTKGSRRRFRSGSDLVVRRGSAPRPNLDVHNVKERGATGAVVIHASSRSGHARKRMRAYPRHTGDFGIALALICGPSALLPDRRRGDPAPGYSGFSLEPWLARSVVLVEDPQ